MQCIALVRHRHCHEKIGIKCGMSGTGKGRLNVSQAKPARTLEVEVIENKGWLRQFRRAVIIAIFNKTPRR